MSIDWKKIRARPAEAEAARDGTAAPTAERVSSILRARARALAAEPAASTPPGDSMDVLAFRMAGEDYGLGLSCLREVQPLQTFTQVPGTPPFVFGITSVRGRVISVIDLRTFFELPGTGISDMNKVIVIQGNGMEFGILADAVAGIRSVQLSALQPSMPTLTGVREAYLIGVTPEPLIILDAEKLLADESLIVDTIAQM